jgi:epoxyqueuosine reductase
MTDLATLVRETGESRGLIAVGFCDARPFLEERTEMRRRITGGEAGRLRFTYGDPEAATDVRRSFPWATGLVVGAITYLPEAGDPGPPAGNTGRIARFATADYYQPLRLALGAIRNVLKEAGYQGEVLVDDNRLVDRAAAVRAGIAWWGKSTMVLMPKYGPWALLGSVVTDAPLPSSLPMRRDCGTCVECIPACPTGALDKIGILDATRCISYWAQVSGTIPLAIREAWGDRLYGCDDCLQSCPPGKKWVAMAAEGRGRVDLLEILGETDERLRQRFGRFYLPRNDPVFLRRNALVALGHCGGSDTVGELARYLEHRRPVLRLHAAWALGRIGSSAATKALKKAAEHESDRSVREEIEAALAAAGERHIPGDESYQDQRADGYPVDE